MRTALAPAGIALLLLVAGCTGGGAAPNQTVTTTPPEPTNSTVSDEPNLPTSRFLNLSIGSSSDLPENAAQHYYLIGNNKSTNRTMTITVWRDANVALNRTIEFPANGVLHVQVFRPGEYTLVIDPAGSRRHVYDAPDTWDCNYRGVEAAIQPDGSLSAISLQSVVYCGTANPSG